MKTTLQFAGVLAAVLAVAATVSAQTYVTPSSQSSVGIVPGYYPGGGYGMDRYSSTVEEGFFNGLGSMFSSIGQANYMNSLAAINAQEAYSRYLQNREKATETYFRLRQINQAARDAQRPQRLTYDQYVALAKKYGPDGLAESQYDRTLGRLRWPAFLLGDEFAPEREALNQAFLVRSPYDAGPTTAFYANVRQLTASMDAKLKAKVDLLSPAEFIAAQKFITGLAYESQQPLVVRALAAAN
jgi:hypothetical protein